MYLSCAWVFFFCISVEALPSGNPHYLGGRSSDQPAISQFFMPIVIGPLPSSLSRDEDQSDSQEDSDSDENEMFPELDQQQRRVIVQQQMISVGTSIGYSAFLGCTHGQVGCLVNHNTGKIRHNWYISWEPAPPVDFEDL